MNTQAKVALDKQKHPERFCRHPRCLWRVAKLDHQTQTYSPRPDCPGGYCPRHQPKSQIAEARQITAMEWFRRNSDNGHQELGRIAKARQECGWIARPREAKSLCDLTALIFWM